MRRPHLPKPLAVANRAFCGACCRRRVCHSGIEAEATRLAQSIFNLLSNASKGAPERSIIRIETVSSELEFGRRAALSIRFTGDWINTPGAELKRIFDNIEQNSITRTGAGLGLAISGPIVLQHRGTIVAKKMAGVVPASPLTCR